MALFIACLHVFPLLKSLGIFHNFQNFGFVVFDSPTPVGDILRMRVSSTIYIYIYYDPEYLKSQKMSSFLRHIHLSKIAI